MKKRIVYYLVVFCLSLLLCSCGARRPDENLIADILPEQLCTITVDNSVLGKHEVYFNNPIVKIEELTIDKDNAIANCIINLENDEYRFTEYVELNLFYNGKAGWEIYNYEYTEGSDGYLKKNPITGRELEISDTLLPEYDLQLSDVKEVLANNCIILNYEYTKEDLLADTFGSIQVWCNYGFRNFNDFQCDISYALLDTEVAWHADGTYWLYWSMSTSTYSFAIDKVDIENNIVSVDCGESIVGDFVAPYDVELSIESYENGVLDLDVAPLKQYFHLTDTTFTNIIIAPDGMYFEGYNPLSNKSNNYGHSARLYWSDLYDEGEAVAAKLDDSLYDVFALDVANFFGAIKVGDKERAVNYVSYATQALGISKSAIEEVTDIMIDYASRNELKSYKVDQVFMLSEQSFRKQAGSKLRWEQSIDYMPEDLAEVIVRIKISTGNEDTIGKMNMMFCLDNGTWKLAGFYDGHLITYFE